MYSDLKAILDRTPQMDQRLDSTGNQLRDMVVFANRLGCYDAADSIKQLLNRKP